MVSARQVKRTKARAIRSKVRYALAVGATPQELALTVFDAGRGATVRLVPGLAQALYDDLGGAIASWSRAQ